MFCESQNRWSKPRLILAVALWIVSAVITWLLMTDYISQLKQRVTLEQVASAVVDLRDAGKTLVGKCPFHAENTPSFHVYRGENRFHCFGCQANGDTLDFVEKFYSLDKHGAIQRLKDIAGELDAGWRRAAQVFQPPVEQRQRQSYKTLTLEQWQPAVDRLWSDVARDGREFLAKRGIGEEVARRLRLGYLSYGTRFAGSGQNDKPEDHERLESFNGAALG